MGGCLESRYAGGAVKYAVSCDYGTQNAFAALLWAFDGRVADVVHGLGKPPTFIIDPSATSFIAAMRQAGFKTKKGRNDVADGIRETGVSLRNGR